MSIVLSCFLVLFKTVFSSRSRKDALDAVKGGKGGRSAEKDRTASKVNIDQDLHEHIDPQERRRGSKESLTESVHYEEGQVGIFFLIRLFIITDEMLPTPASVFPSLSDGQ